MVVITIRLLVISIISINDLVLNSSPHDNRKRAAFLYLNKKICKLGFSEKVSVSVVIKPISSPETQN